GEQVVADPSTQSVLLFCEFSTVWRWSGTAWQEETLQDPEGDGNPTARQKSAVVYEPVRQEFIDWGRGNSGTDLYNVMMFVPINETWIYRNRSFSKADEVLPTTFPLNSGTAATIDGGVLVFGGNSYSGPTNQTFLWNGYSFAGVLSAPSDGGLWPQ